MSADRRPKVTFVLPIYNGAATLPGCLDSLFSLRLGEWECIAVDDGSSDTSGDLVASAARREARLTLVRHDRNQGVSRARNSGLDRARGEYVHFLDQDDHLQPGGVGQLCRMLDRNADSAGAYGDYMLVDTRSGVRRLGRSPARPLTFEDFKGSNFVPPIANLARLELVRRVGGLQVGMEGCDDWDLWGRLTRMGSPFLYCSTVVGEYRIHHSNNARNAARMLQSSLEVIEVLHSADVRVPNPAWQWAQGAPVSHKVVVQARALWSQVAMVLAAKEVDSAVDLVEAFIDGVGSAPITAASASEMHYAMDTFAAAYAGLDPRTYLQELEPVLNAFFVRLEARLASPGLAGAAFKQLRDKYVSAMIEENARLAQLAENYRTSRSYRLGRFLRRCFAWH